MSKRTKRERRRPATDALPETKSQSLTDRQYSRYTHRQLTATKSKAIPADLPDNMPRPLKRALGKSVARLEKLAAAGKEVPALNVDYHDSDGGVSTFIYTPGKLADQIACEILEAAFLLQQREGVQA